MNDSDPNPMMKLKIPSTVYPPREDTHLLINCIPSPTGDRRRALEIGSGTGVVSIEMANLGWDVTAIDVNPMAVAATSINSKLNLDMEICVIEGSFDEIPQLKSGAFDLIVWNLPYLDVPVNRPELEAMEESSMIDVGIGGWSSELRLHLEQNNAMLSPGGLVVLLYRVLPESPSRPYDWLKSGWSVRRIESKQLGDETLSVYAHWLPWGGSQPLRVQEIGSTMEFKFPNLRKSERVFSNYQTNGRGRKGRRWVTDPKGVTGTWSVPTPTDLSPGLVQLSIGVMVSRALGMKMKWPNDIVDEEFRKCGGVLTILDSNNRLKIGVGVNKHPQPASGIETGGWYDYDQSLETEDATKLIDAAVSSCIEHHELIGDFLDGFFMEDIWSSLSSILSLGVQVRFEGSISRVVGVSRTGELIVSTKGDVHAVSNVDSIQWLFPDVP